MKVNAPHHILFAILGIIAVMLTGCGGDAIQGVDCPSGTYVANTGDVLIGPDDATFTGTSSVGAPYPGGTLRYPPITFKIVDAFNNAKNDVCVVVYTGGVSGLGSPFWYTDSSYATIITTGVGPMQRRVLKTDSVGNVVLYWSSSTLPPGNPRVLTTPPSTYTAGADQKGSSWISIYSGSLSQTWTLDWTVTGEPAS